MAKKRVVIEIRNIDMKNMYNANTFRALNLRASGFFVKSNIAGFVRPVGLNRKRNNNPPRKKKIKYVERIIYST